MVNPTGNPVVMWFRRDLRLSDNPALHAAIETGRSVVCVYVHDEASNAIRPIGGASKWWLDKSLAALSEDIRARGGKLILRSGPTKDVVLQLARELGCSAIYWNRRYGLDERTLDTEIKTDFAAGGIEAFSFNGSLLTEPWVFKTGSGGHYKVFSPYWRAVQANYTPHESYTPPEELSGMRLPSEKLDDWNLHPHSPDWSTGFTQKWTPGEAGANDRVDQFLETAVNTYGKRPQSP